MHLPRRYLDVMMPHIQGPELVRYAFAPRNLDEDSGNDLMTEQNQNSLPTVLPPEPSSFFKTFHRAVRSCCAHVFES